MKLYIGYTWIQWRAKKKKIFKVQGKKQQVPTQALTPSSEGKYFFPIPVID